jgi:hypothetical protein
LRCHIAGNMRIAADGRADRHLSSDILVVLRMAQYFRRRCVVFGLVGWCGHGAAALRNVSAGGALAQAVESVSGQAGASRKRLYTN